MPLSTRVRSAAIAYLMLQGALIAMFWFALATRPEWRPWFIPRDTP